MNVVTPDWSERHKELQKIIRKAGCFSKSIDMILGLHSELNASEVSGSINKNAVDLLFDDLQQNEFSIMPSSKDETIAWAIWHVARIEDLTMNILVNHDSQVFNDSWKQRLKVAVTDTGNAMTDDEIMKFSKEICVSELLNYRNAVGVKSQKIVQQLNHDDMHRKISSENVLRILLEGGVAEQKESRWLLDFWGKKDVSGIILMPLIRHQSLHLNDCYKWKEIIRTKKKFYAV